MADGGPTPRQRLAIDREAARARSEAGFEALVDDYPVGHRSGRDSFVRTEAQKVEKDIDKRYMDAIPEVDRRDRRIRMGGGR